jgi:hypothetical protein
MLSGDACIDLTDFAAAMAHVAAERGFIHDWRG